MNQVTQVKDAFDQLGAFQPRMFVPTDCDFSDPVAVESLFRKLNDYPVNSSEELEKWLDVRSEFKAALDQFGSVLYIRMTCQTDHPPFSEGYKQFIEKISPIAKKWDDELNKKYLNLRKRFLLDQSRYEVFDRAVRTDIELFVEKNIELQTKVELLSQEYQTVCGAMSVEFQGKERTMPEMGKYLLENDRPLRESAWRATAARRLKDKDTLDDIFDQMLKLRHQVALNAKFSNYRDYRFRSLYRFDYTPEDCKKYHDSVEKCLVPLWGKILEKRRKEMKLESLRPWDTAVDPLGREPLKPFEKVDELIDGCQRIFNQVSPEFGAMFADMKARGLLDLASRKGKAPGGYQSSLAEARKPFIFMNSVGLDGDMRTLLHEGGHAFHALLCCQDKLIEYRHAPMEFCEVASMGMELLGDPFLKEFYKNKEEAQRSIQEHFEDVIFILIWVATIDAFQHWIYENPNHTRDERRQKWLAIRRRFDSNFVDWSGLEEEHAYLWHRQLHIFEVPFYYIEYGIAQLGALQLWLNSKRNFVQAVSDYRRGLSLGGSKPLPEIFKTAGLRFDFSESTIAPLVKEVERELGF